jgi:two-component system, NarL family, response regulator LiaR
VQRAGASGYVRKDTDPEILLAAVRAVAAGKTYIDPAIARQLTRTPDPDALTPKEAEVLRHVASGESNRVIAAAPGVSEETVKTHVANLLSKLQAENRAQATVQARDRAGLRVGLSVVALSCLCIAGAVRLASHRDRVESGSTSEEIA